MINDAGGDGADVAPGVLPATGDEHESDKVAGGRVGQAAALLVGDGECRYLRRVTTHCCDRMRKFVEHRCAQHPDPQDCPDHLVTYVAKYREYGLVIHDGGSSYMGIHYCPWCGSKLPDSQRNRWFDEVERLGVDPWTQDVPAEFEDERWLGDS